MSRPTKPGVQRFYPILTCGIFAVVAVVLIICSNFYVTLAQPTFSAFEPEKQLTQAEKVPSQLQVYMDTSASMYGFMHTNRPSCIPSSYLQVRNDMRELSKALSHVTETVYYQFNSATQINIDISEEERAQLHRRMRTTEMNLTKQNQYAEYPQASGQTTALSSVLNLLNLANPAIIVTDLELNGLSQSTAELEKSLSRIFDSAKCVSVLAMKSAFSGNLYNYTNEGKHFAYGTAKDMNTFQQIAMKYPNHNHPRTFYAIIIGTQSQCRNLSSALTQQYTKWNQANIIDQKAAIDEADAYSHKENFIAVEQADFWLNDRFELIAKIDGDNALVINSSNAALAADSPWSTQDVPEYLLQKTKENTVCQLEFSVRPLYWGYAMTASTDQFSTPVPQMARVHREQIKSDQLEESSGVLNARGSRKIVLSLEPFEDHYQWFTCSEVTKRNERISFSVTIQLADCDKGLYRMTIPVLCRHSTKIKPENNYGWADSWNNNPINLKALLKNDITTPSRTNGLTNWLNLLGRQEISRLSQNENVVALLTIDLKVE